MLVNCKPGCPGKRGTTNVLLDVEENEAICDFCQEIISLSSFSKNSMKQRGEIIRKDNRKAFQFSCKTCGQSVPVFLRGDKPYGKDCENDCEFGLSKFTIQALKSVEKVRVEDDKGNL